MADPFTILKIIIFVASATYSVTEAKKAKKRALAAAEGRKGFEITVSGTATPLPIAYGKNVFGGIEVSHKVTNTFTTASRNSDDYFYIEGYVDTSWGRSHFGKKNEFLHIQYALCQDGIEGVVDVKVNGLQYDDADQGFHHYFRTHNNGGAADSLATANGFPSTNVFTGVAHASATYRLNRDDPQYNGVPIVEFMVKGRKVRAVELNSGVYSLSTSYIYSNNPALCLLDYLLNVDFGRGISVDELDLESFYNSAVVCGTTVSSGRAISGSINGGVGTRDVPLYECNITLDPDETIRDNINSIIDTMAMAELTWSSEGKYKLLVEYPTSAIEQDALVDASHYFTDDDIVRDNVTLAWPSASDRFNQVTVNFFNEHEDFKTDSITWPKTNSTAHTTYLTEDNSQPFIGTYTLDGITDPYHATASAEQLVRQSRSLKTLSLTVTKKGLSLEPGDFINVTSTTSNIDDEVFRVQSIEVMADFTVKLTCYSFDYTTLAWNVNDDIAYSVRPTYDFAVEPVTSLVYTAGRPSGDHTALAELTWTAPTDGSFKSIVYYTVDGGDLVVLGETSNESFYIHRRPDWTDGQSVTFTVKAQTPLGRLSTGVEVTSSVVKSPEAPTSFSISETLYQTNKASGVKARATISFSEPAGGVEPKDYKIEYYRDEDGSTYELLGYTVGQKYVFNDIRAGNYHFRITPVSWFDDDGTALVGTKLILGLSAIPSDPTGLSSKLSDTSILLTWDTPADLDVISGGHTEIRYARDDGAGTGWELAQTLVSNISGSTTTATLPVVAGYYLIKHIDSSGNECATASQVFNAITGADYNAITTITEDPTFAGTKTNCTVVSSNLELDASVTSMTYLLNNSIDLGSVENIRLAPSITAVITDGVTTVADYTLISDVTKFSGPIVDAALTFEVRYTEDDPAGTPTWSDWETFTVGSYRKRAFEFRLTGVVATTTYTISISALSITADKADVTKRGTSTGSASVDTTITFATAFYGGIGGSDVPYVGINTVGGTGGDDVNIVSISKTNFVYSVYNAGSRVARNITWQAVGQ